MLPPEGVVMLNFSSICKDKRRLGMLALAVSLLLGLVGPIQGYAVHFLRGIFLGVALTLMISDLYQRRRLFL